MFKDLEGFIETGSKEEELAGQIDFTKLPHHVAVIMDGNGRWAKKRDLPRVEGHRAGAKSVREIVETAARVGIEYLTLYAFSKENWKRPKLEVAALWKFLEDYLKKDFQVLLENNLSLQVIGQIQELPFAIRKELDRVINLTRVNDGMVIIMALNYGGRAEIVDAIKKLTKEKDFNPDALDEKRFSEMLYAPDVPDPDLLIRTSGEFRISNFLLWQIAYSEIWLTKELWPDFRKRHFFEAVIDYQRRERRFGEIIPKKR
jgi:undecaprenyl diphosphate synthase